MDNFIKFLVKNNYSNSTINTYKSIIKKYDASMHDMRLIKTKILSIENANSAWTHYNVMCSYLEFKKDSRIKSLKQIKLEQIPQVYRKEISKKQIYKLAHDVDNPKHAVVRFLFETGIRAAELKTIFDIQTHTLKVIGKGNKIREVFHKNVTTQLITNIKITSKTVTCWVKEVMGDDVTPHTLRRSHATHMLLNGANPKTVMMQLGHTKIETTYRYLQISKKAHKRIYDKHF